jgi:hypothetical protein
VTSQQKYVSQSFRNGPSYGSCDIRNTPNAGYYLGTFAEVSDILKDHYLSGASL